MDSQVLELPYVGKNLSMLIILPNEIQDETTGLQKVRQQKLYGAIFHYLELLVNAALIYKLLKSLYHFMHY